jgi:hypothetical protein
LYNPSVSDHLHTYANASINEDSLYLDTNRTNGLMPTPAHPILEDHGGETILEHNAEGQRQMHKTTQGNKFPNYNKQQYHEVSQKRTQSVVHAPRNLP